MIADDVNRVLPPRLEGGVSFALLTVGIVSPMVILVTTDQLFPSLVPLAVLASLFALIRTGLSVFARLTEYDIEPVLGGVYLKDPGALMYNALKTATILCAWMSLGTFLLFLWLV